MTDDNHILPMPLNTLPVHLLTAMWGMADVALSDTSIQRKIYQTV
ncbi:MAG: hypothetical protein H6Q26_206 [Bacteroidetes bacterium]|nr:hypothetical protein [Bacteroidota bacterium]